LPFCHVLLQARRLKSTAYPVALGTYGDYLRAKRLDLGLLQKQVADVIGVNKCSIYNWENNRVEPAVRLIPRIIQFLEYCPYTPGSPPGARLTAVRQSLGFSQEKMAQRLGADESTLRRWETGRRQPSLEYQGRINVFLDSLNCNRLRGEEGQV
jgi:transcriptional regulator with XRE-family HTH domain